MNAYRVRQFQPRDLIQTDVPASKSLLNRALILAAFGKGEVFLACGSYADDTRALLDCLSRLGIRWKREQNGLRVSGCGGQIPVQSAELDVRSAGTAARFLTAVLAVLGGDYRMSASPQMQRRPMELLAELERAGVVVEYEGERGHFPFRIRSDGLHAQSLTVDTDLSTQYASGLLLAAAISHPLTLHLTGSRTDGSYIRMTLLLMEKFGATFHREGNTVSVIPSPHNPPLVEIEADLSGACYFYAMALLFSTRVLVRRIHSDTWQGDKKFLEMLAERGVLFSETPEGLLADGRDVRTYDGFVLNMRNCSDQALTVAALAPFARSATNITGIGHIRRQECDRIRAIVQNLTQLGVPVTEHADGVTIEPSPIRGGTIKTFGDHRVAMAFSLIGLRTGNLTIDDAACCAKTFDNYFDILDRLTK